VILKPLRNTFFRGNTGVVVSLWKWALESIRFVRVFFAKGFSDELFVRVIILVVEVLWW
jgi:hypothetical protein